MNTDRNKIFGEMAEAFHKVKFDDMTGEILTKQIGTDGREYNDPTPMAPPIGYKRAPSMVEIIREQVRHALLAQAAEASGHETFEEADDFDIGDDYDPSTPWENDFDPPIAEVLAEAQRALDERNAPKTQPPVQAPAPGVAPQNSEPGAGPQAAPAAPHSTST